MKNIKIRSNHHLREQKECGLDKLSTEERLRLRKHNDEYRFKKNIIGIILCDIFKKRQFQIYTPYYISFK